jgi:opacity protein-like surface antigen
MKTILLTFVLAIGCLAQPIGVGIKGGLPFNDVFDDGANIRSETKRYIVGPMIELRLPAGFAIEGNALYNRVKFDSVLGATGSIAGAVLDADNWEFPVLLKYKFGGADAVAAAVRPYIAAGASFRRISDITSIPSFITGNRDGEVDKSNTGFVIGGGLEIRALFLKVAPELRFTHWGTDHFTAGLANVLKTNRNQGQFLIGLYF